MKIETTFNGLLLSRKAKDYDVNGQKGTSYVLGLKVGNDIGELPCTKKVYDMIEEYSIPDFSKVLLYGEYDSNYKRFRLFDIIAE